MKRILYVPFDQLHRRYGILKSANPQEDLIVMVESKRMTTGDQWHKVRLYFLISSARHFAEELKTEGFTVHYVQAETTEVGLKKIQESENLPIYACEQSSYRLTKSLENLGATFLENDFFLTPRKLFFQWAEKQKSFVMENFYRAQRIRLNILVEGVKPVGGEWNFDKENRLPPPKNYTFPPYLVHAPDSIDAEVAHQL
ncbi:MAG: cryptochrome/photolyase family protein, partial [Actinobacteria bacterium]|nr:cryptochrome/photolyase family protein [Actinomycetota bacterium]